MSDWVRGQEEVFRRVLAHRAMLKAYVQAIVRDPVLAEDTFSDVTLEIARSWERFDVTRAFDAGRNLAHRWAPIPVKARILRIQRQGLRHTLLAK